MKNLICKIFGHRESVVWNMNKLTGKFCSRCKTWTSSTNRLVSNCCGASDIYNGNLDNNEGVCADCGEHCEMERV